jgi:hypothetical protein
MTGYDAFGIYQSLKLHFSQESYDFFKYNGKTNVSVNAFENRKDKYHFYKLSRKYTNKDDLISFLVANFLEDDKSWIGKLLEEDAEIIYKRRQKVLQSLSYTFEKDCNEIFGDGTNPNEKIKVVDGDYPVLLQLTLQKVIEIETFCILTKILGFLPMWNKKIGDTIRWPDFHRKVVKYSVFLPQDVVKYKMILKKVIHD